ncbi:MAG: hypothetical protein DRJ08_06595 [Acidobacteria bacterium]|nr:MAG: hypothetical protein DRJ08_06595 [Acidobacteriota bacterium]
MFRVLCSDRKKIKKINYPLTLKLSVVVITDTLLTFPSIRTRNTGAGGAQNTSHYSVLTGMR